MDGTKELEYLLNNYWCCKEVSPELYLKIKNNLDYYKDFIQTKLGSRLIVNPRFIKLEKIPAVPKSYMGINSFNDKLEYIILFIVLIFLEDKPKLEQFILSNLIDYVSNTATTLEIDTIPNWNIHHHRKCLVNVINHLKDLNIIRVVEEKNTFTDDVNAEALYETTGLSNYYVKEFKGNIKDYHTLEDFINDEFELQDDTIGDVRRYKVYRQLLYSIAAYKEDLSEAELDYLKRFRSTIVSEFDKYTNSELELTKNMALLFFSEEASKKEDFPNTKAISDIVLLVNREILNKIDEGIYELSEDETIYVYKEEIEELIRDVYKKHNMYFSKNLRDLNMKSFIETVINYMKEYDFIRDFDNNYKIYPLVMKLIGVIPIMEEESDIQLGLFGDDVNE